MKWTTCSRSKTIDYVCIYNLSFGLLWYINLAKQCKNKNKAETQIRKQPGKTHNDVLKEFMAVNQIAVDTFYSKPHTGASWGH